MAVSIAKRQNLVVNSIHESANIPSSKVIWKPLANPGEGPSVHFGSLKGSTICNGHSSIMTEKLPVSVGTNRKKKKKKKKRKFFSSMFFLFPDTEKSVFLLQESHQNNPAQEDSLFCS
jgi:hypothetical protein